MKMFMGDFKGTDDVVDCGGVDGYDDADDGSG